MILDCILDKQTEQFEPDSGAVITTINEIYFKSFIKPPLSDRTALRVCNRDSVRVLGKKICISLKKVKNEP